LKGDLILLKKTAACSYTHVSTLATPAKKAPYLLIKTISHYLVKLHMILNSMFQKELTIEEGIYHINVLRDKLVTLQHNYPNEARDETAVIDRTLLIIAEASSAVDLKQIEQLYEPYFLGMKEHHERYGRQATKYQLHGLEAITSKWISDHLINLKSTYIIIVGSRGPKKNLIEKQYFDSLRIKHGISTGNTPYGGIIYSEMLPEQMDIHYSVLVNDLARDLRNQDVAANMLNNREAMYEDILGRHAKLILLDMEKSKESIPYCKTSLWGRFWKPQEHNKSISKCPFHGR